MRGSANWISSLEKIYGACFDKINRSLITDSVWPTDYYSTLKFRSIKIEWVKLAYECTLVHIYTMTFIILKISQTRYYICSLHGQKLKSMILYLFFKVLAHFFINCFWLNLMKYTTFREELCCKFAGWEQSFVASSFQVCSEGCRDRCFNFYDSFFRLFSWALLELTDFCLLLDNENFLPH
jgi:hypothetical protein